MLVGTESITNNFIHFFRRKKFSGAFHSLNVNWRVDWVFWEQKTPGGSAIESQSLEEESSTSFSPVFPLSAFFPLNAEADSCNKNIMFILDSDAMP